MPELTGGLFAPDSAAGPPKIGAGAVPPAFGFGSPTFALFAFGTIPPAGDVADPPAVVPPTLGLTAFGATAAPPAGAGACAKATGAEVQSATDNEPAIIHKEILLLFIFDSVSSSRMKLQ